MNIKYSRTGIIPMYTNTEPIKVKLELEAVGSFDEIEWFIKHLEMIGTKESLATNEEDTK